LYTPVDKGYTRIYRGIQGYTGAYKGIQRFRGVYKGIQRFTGVYKGKQRFTRVYKGLQGYTRVYKGLQGYTGVDKGIQGYTSVNKGLQGYTSVYRGILKLKPYSRDIIAELRRPEEPLSGAPYSYRKEKETHELIFSWLSWLAVLLVGAYARRRRRQHSGQTSAHVRAIEQLKGYKMFKQATGTMILLVYVGSIVI